MSTNYGFYADAGLTVPLSVGGVQQVAGGSPVDRLIYFGNPTAGRRLQAVSDPGVDPVVLEVVDGDEGGGLPASAVRLALSSGALDTAEPGDPITLGTTLLSGAENAVAVYVRTDAGEAALGTYDDLSLAVFDVVETEV